MSVFFNLIFAIVVVFFIITIKQNLRKADKLPSKIMLPVTRLLHKEN